MSEMKRFNDDNLVAVMASNAGYDWSELRAWFADGRYYVYSKSGCSCDSFEDSYNGFDGNNAWPVEGLHALYKKGSDFASENKYVLDANDYVHWVEQIDAARSRGLGV